MCEKIEVLIPPFAARLKHHMPTSSPFLEMVKKSRPSFHPLQDGLVLDSDTERAYSTVFDFNRLLHRVLTGMLATIARISSASRSRI